MTALVAQSEKHAWELIRELAQECSGGLSNREGEALTLAILWRLDQTEVREIFADARKVAIAKKPKSDAAAKMNAATARRQQTAPHRTRWARHLESVDCFQRKSRQRRGKT